MAKTGNDDGLGTAEGAVMGRALHTERDRDPVLSDTWAVHLLSETSRSQVLDPDWREDTSAFDSRPILALGIGSLRYAEDAVERAVADGIDQYVILGAGFDTFALRRHDLAGRLQVFEVDHPDVQALKRRRVEQAAASPAARPTFVPVDFESDDWLPRLEAAGFDAGRRAIFSWMNTIPYLTEDATTRTLREIGTTSCAGSRLVLNYSAAVALTEDQQERLKQLFQVVAQSAEPMRSRFAPSDFEKLLSEAGFALREHATERDLDERYFADRTDGLRPGLPARLIDAEVAAD